MAPHPVIETERLVLQPPQAADLDDYAEYWQLPGVVRYIGGKPINREEAWAKLLRQAGLWSLLGFGFFVVREKGSGRFVGSAGFQELQRDLKPSIAGTLEAGWGVRPEYQGAGYAREAMTASMAWAAESFPAYDYSCIIDPANQPSLRLALHLGFREQACTVYLGEPIVVLRRRRAG